MLPKKTPNQPLKRSAERSNHWHWLIKHPVEFSKNNHTPKPDPQPRRPALGATAQPSPVDFVGARSKIFPTPPKFVQGSEPAAKRVDRRSGLADRPTIVE